MTEEAVHDHQRFSLQGRLSRRAFLRAGGASAGLVFLAGCGVGGTSDGTSASAAASPAPSPTGTLVFANWPGYIYPSAIKQFEAKSGTSVNYREVIEDYDSFFGTLRQPLASGQATGYDLIMLADWLVAKMAKLGYLVPLDKQAIPNFTQNAVSSLQDPSYDPGASHSATWLSGITGIGYNRSVTGRDISSIDDLFSSEFKGKVMMSLEMRETMGLTLLSLGIEPATATVADAKGAQAKLLEQRDSGVLRSYAEFGDRLQALNNGDAAVSMIVAGDLLLAAEDNPDLQFAIPDEGAITWNDNIAIPVHAEHVGDALAFINFMYDPANAASMVEYINYFTPVPAAKEVLTTRAQDATSAKDRQALEALAHDPYVFPDDAVLAKLHRYNVLTDEQEEKQWNDLFQEVVQG